MKFENAVKSSSSRPPAASAWQGIVSSRECRFPRDCSAAVTIPRCACPSSEVRRVGESIPRATVPLTRPASGLVIFVTQHEPKFGGQPAAGWLLGRGSSKMRLALMDGLRRERSVAQVSLASLWGIVTFFYEVICRYLCPFHSPADDRVCHPRKSAYSCRNCAREI